MTRIGLKFTVLLILVATAWLAKAQVSIQGKVVDAEYGKPIPYATIILQDLQDNQAIDGAIADVEGTFVIEEVEPGAYSIIVKMVGYDPFIIDSLRVTYAIDLGIITMQVAATELEEVVVRAKRSVVETHLGKRVVNIGEDLTNSGGTVVDVLEQVPSVATDIDGNVSIRGSGNIIIYVNGKETQRDSRSLANIPAAALQQVEVITNPSARFDAEGVAGIINLVYTKSKFSKKEFEITASVSQPSRLAIGFNSSISSKRLSFYLNASERRSWYLTSNDQIRVNFSDSLQQYDNLISTNGLGAYRNITSGFSFEPDSTLSANLEFNYWRWDDDGDDFRINNFFYSNANSSFSLRNSSLEIEDELAISLSLEKKWNKQRSLQLLLSASGEDETNDANFNLDNIELSATPFANTINSSFETEKQRLYQAKLDYTAPLMQAGQIETGIKIDKVQYEIDQLLDFRSDTLFLPRNQFKVDLNKVAAYMIFSKQFSKFEIGIGARVEHFTSVANQLTLLNVSRQEFTNLFPSLQMLYKYSGSGSVAFNYSKRISRPGFFDLNPFVSFTDPLVLSTGNPLLEPEFANAFELTFSDALANLHFDFTAFRRQTKNVIQRTIRALNEDQLLLSYANFGRQLNHGLETSVSWEPGKVVDITGSASAYHTNISEDSNDTGVRFNNDITWQARLQQRFTASGDITIEITQYYRAPYINAQSEEREQYYVNLGIRKLFNKKKGTITLSATDIFNTRVFGSTIRGEDFEISREFKFQTHRVALGLRYKL